MNNLNKLTIGRIKRKVGKRTEQNQIYTSRNLWKTFNEPFTWNLPIDIIWINRMTIPL